MIDKINYENVAWGAGRKFEPRKVRSLDTNRTTMGWGIYGQADRQGISSCMPNYSDYVQWFTKLCIQEMRGMKFKNFTLEYKATVGNRIVYALLQYKQEMRQYGLDWEFWNWKF
jgi:hypothetical protein